jgi:hypothetical protein
MDLSKTSIFLVGLILTHEFCWAEDPAKPDDKPMWASSYMRELAREQPLELFHVSQDSEHLLGGLSLTRMVKEPDRQLIIQGHLAKSGEFAPNISLAVSDREDGNWKIIYSSFSDKVDVTLTGGRHVDSLTMRIQLDALQPYIGKYKFCRISLQTGESDVIPMVWLTPKGGD